MSRLAVNGAALNVTSEGSGPVVLALHGFTGSVATWRGFTEAARGDFTVVAVDMLGHGASDAPDDPARYTMERCVEDLAGVLDHLGIRQAVWMGSSMGGRIALACATIVPERCAALVLEGASPGLADEGERLQRMVNDEALARRILREGARPFVDYWESIPLFASQARLSPEARATLRAQRLKNDARGLANSLKGAGTGAQPPVHDRLPSLDMPVLCVVGAEDTKFRAIGQEMCRVLPKSTLAVIPDAGHATHLEQPQQFNRTVLEFLRGLDMRDARPASKR